MKLVHWPLMGGLLHMVQRGGDWAGAQPAQTGRTSEILVFIRSRLQIPDNFHFHHIEE